MTRVQLRRTMRQRRRLLTPSERVRYATLLAKKIQGLRSFRNCQRLAVYLPNDGEIDLTLLIHWATNAGKSCYLPILCPLGHRRLWFAPYHPGDRLQLNRLHIPEPMRSLGCRIRAQRLDLVIVPLVAFDIQGNRLGMGGGYYDQTLAFLAYRRYWHKPQVIGVAYDFQQVAALQPRPWDIPLSTIVTEARIYTKIASN